jgi:hypothetical protein
MSIDDVLLLDVDDEDGVVVTIIVFGDFPFRILTLTKFTVAADDDEDEDDEHRDEEEEIGRFDELSPKLLLLC